MVVGGEVTYCELAKRAKRLAATIQTGRAEWREGVPPTAVFAYRSETAYAVILGALMAAARRRRRTFSLLEHCGEALQVRAGLAWQARHARFSDSFRTTDKFSIEFFDAFALVRYP